MPKELYIKQKDVARSATQFDRLCTPLGLDVREKMIADGGPRPKDANEYDGSTDISEGSD